MNWEAIGAVGEIIGAIAVGVTLVYLAVQVRRSTAATQTATVQLAASLDKEFLLALGSDPIKAQLWTSYMSAPHTLPVEQVQQGHFLMRSMLRRLENIQIQKQLDTLSKPGWRSRQAMFDVIANSQGYSAFLDSPTAAFMDAEFLKYIAQFKAGT